MCTGERGILTASTNYIISKARFFWVQQLPVLAKKPPAATRSHVCSKVLCCLSNNCNLFLRCGKKHRSAPLLHVVILFFIKVINYKHRKDLLYWCKKTVTPTHTKKQKYSKNKETKAVTTTKRAKQKQIQQTVKCEKNEVLVFVILIDWMLWAR